jgi:hypothetical protein
MIEGLKCARRREGPISLPSISKRKTIFQLAYRCADKDSDPLSIGRGNVEDSIFDCERGRAQR